jgi:hypothetical protein
VSLFRRPARDFLAALPLLSRRLPYEVRTRQGVALEWCRVLHCPEDADPHAHYLLRTGGDFDEEALLRLWRRCCPQDARDDADAHLAPARSPPALAHYLAGNAAAGAIPPGWRGQAVTYSRGFLTAPRRALWAECLAEWYG